MLDVHARQGKFMITQTLDGSISCSGHVQQISVWEKKTLLSSNNLYSTVFSVHLIEC